MEIDLCTHQDFLAILTDLEDFWGSDRARAVHHPMFVHEFGDTAWVIPSPVLPLMVAGLAYGGIVSFANIVWFSALQDNVPQDVLSRVSSFDFFGSAVLRPLGYSIMGPISSTVGIPAALVIPSGIFVALSVTVGVLMRGPLPAESKGSE